MTAVEIISDQQDVQNAAPGDRSSNFQRVQLQYFELILRKVLLEQIFSLLHDLFGCQDI